MSANHADEALVRYRGLVARHDQATAEVDRLRSEIDATLAEIVQAHGWGGVKWVAEQLGLSRSEIERRIRRHRLSSR